MRLHRKWNETKVVELVASSDLMIVAVAVAVAAAVFKRKKAGKQDGKK